VAFAIVPMFALANAGVSLSGDALGGLVSDPVTVGVGLGLVAGKTIGVFAAVVIAVRLGIGRLPTGATWRHMFGVAVCAGIGFTVALFVASLSFTDPGLTDSAKVGILAGSLVAGVLGYAVLRTAPAAEPGGDPADEDGVADAGAGEATGDPTGERRTEPVPA
jgi:NhaA family Na+:H+ antiporter